MTFQIGESQDRWHCGIPDFPALINLDMHKAILSSVRFSGKSLPTGTNTKAPIGSDWGLWYPRLGDEDSNLGLRIQSPLSYR